MAAQKLSITGDMASMSNSHTSDAQTAWGKTLIHIKQNFKTQKFLKVTQGWDILRKSSVSLPAPARSKSNHSVYHLLELNS